MKKSTKPKVRTCRVCGCTHNKPCILKYGQPCAWVDKDLCSACRLPSKELIANLKEHIKVLQYSYRDFAAKKVIKPEVVRDIECLRQTIKRIRDWAPL